jgi:uncharacterized protein YukE
VNLVGDPAAIRQTAAQLRQKAGQLEDLGRRIESRANGCSWQCTRADRFRDAMAQRSTHTPALVQRLRDAARALDGIARDVQSQINFLHNLENRARAILAADAAAGARLLKAGWSVSHLPGKADPAWQSIMRTLEA